MKCPTCQTELFDDGSENDRNRPVIPDSPHGRTHVPERCLAVVVAQRDEARAKLATAVAGIESAMASPMNGCLRPGCHSCAPRVLEDTLHALGIDPSKEQGK
jgi:hypothetical protein